LGRPAVVPPAGRGWGWMCASAGALGGERWGAFSESAEGGVAGSEIQPYRRRAGVGCGRLGDPALPWGRWVRWGWTERTRSLPGGAPELGVAGSEIQPYLEDAG
jgi:hypothetical protein